jgi:parvulin-like peptidyl-prolyl isomerase
MSRRVVALLAAALLALGATACGGGDDDDGGGGGSSDVPSGAVATVGGAEISEKELDAQVAALARAQRGGGDKPTPAVHKQLEAQALSSLLMRRALEQEAADRDIRVSRAEVRRRWRTISRSQFKTKKALRRFLGGQTERDLIEQLRLQTLTERIHEQVAKEAGGGKQGAKAVKEFQGDFEKRLQERTACRKAYAATAGCAGD